MSAIDTGDTAWMLAATALVLLMTPALGLFYAGLVRSKNTLNTFMMCVAAIAIATVTWAAIGYSFAFGDANEIIGGFDYAFMKDVTLEPLEGQTIPHLLFFAFQATFCIITVALVSGAVVERMRFSAFMIFAALWSVLVYSVLAHWAFGPGWLLNGGTLDFAGGVAVEMASGFSALAAALVVGARKDYGRQALLPHNAVYVLMGAGLLWFGWFGFNGGSGFGTGANSMLAFVQHAAHPRRRPDHLVHARPDPGPHGHGGRRGHRDHRRLRADHPRRRLHQPRLGARARRRRRAAVLGAWSPTGRARGWTRRWTCSPPTASRASRESCSSGSSRTSHGTGSPTASSTATRTSSWDQALAAAAAPAYAFGATFILLKVLGALMPLRADEKQESIGMDVLEHGEEAYATGEGAILVMPPDGDGGKAEVPVADPA